MNDAPKPSISWVGVLVDGNRQRTEAAVLRERNIRLLTQARAA